MLRWRLLLGTALIAGVIGLCWLDALAATPGIWLLPLALAATVLATRELLDLLAAAGMRPVPWVIYLMNVLLVTSPWMLASEHLQRFFIPDLLLNIGVPVLVIFLAEMCRYEKPGGSTANIAAGILALVYVGMLLRLAVSLRIGWGMGALASWIIVVKMGDIGAYTVGRLIGRHKMAPLISPGKTIEGAGGALLFSCFAAWATFRWLVPLAASESLFWLLDASSTASRFSGSLARSMRLAAGHCWAPICQAAPSATTWSIGTSCDVPRPRTNWIVVPVYGSCRTPELTTQPFVFGLRVTPARSRRRMSLRVSQPLWPHRSPLSSVQAGPNCARE